MRKIVSIMIFPKYRTDSTVYADGKVRVTYDDGTRQWFDMPHGQLDPLCDAIDRAAAKATPK